MVERLYRSDPEWLLGEWFEAGRRLGDRLRVLHPTLEDLQAGLSGLQSLIAERRIEVQRKPGGKETQPEIQLRVFTDLTPELATCGGRFVEGVLSAYSFRSTESRVKAGTIEIAAVYSPTRPAGDDEKGPKPRARPRHPDPSHPRGRKSSRVNP